MDDWNDTIVDVETTGLSPARDRVIEIGALVVEKREVFDLDTYKILKTCLRNPKNRKNIRPFRFTKETQGGQMAFDSWDQKGFSL